ncbi:hypothetical protein BT96DRAFT_918958, partial [Gymnopus androsaceus JB14]
MFSGYENGICDQLITEEDFTASSLEEIEPIHRQEPRVACSSESPDKEIWDIAREHPDADFILPPPLRKIHSGRPL